jgi:hypothetical protein
MDLVTTLDAETSRDSDEVARTWQSLPPAKPTFEALPSSSAKRILHVAGIRNPVMETSLSQVTKVAGRGPVNKQTLTPPSRRGSSLWRTDTRI